MGIIKGLKMQIKSLTHNFFMYFLRMFTSFGFTLLIFPYVARKIGVEGIGQVQYIETINIYFILFINLGILGYGRREVAQVRDNSNKLNELVNELLSILTITTLFGSLFYFILFLLTKDIFLKKLLSIYFISILLNFISFEWFYIGIENQEYITKRNLLIKIISAILIFIFVKESKDIYLYAGILVLATAGSNIYNFINLKKHMKLKLVKYKEYKKHLKSLFFLFASSLATTLAYNLDSIMIKNIIGDLELGYYTLALKFGRLPLVIGTTLIGVLSPRLNNLLSQGKKKEFYNVWNKGINIMFIFYIPCLIGMWLISKSLVLIFGGNQFLPAVNIFKVFSVYILIMGFAVSTGVALSTHRRDKEYFISVMSGSILNVIFNIIFIPKIGAVGAAIATLITEVVAIIIRILLCRDIFQNIKILNINMIKMLISSLVMGVVVFYITKIINNPLIQVIMSGILGGVIYFIGLFLLKEDLICEVINKLKEKYKNKGRV